MKGRRLPVIFAAVCLADFCLVLARGGIVWLSSFLSVLALLWALESRAPGRLWRRYPGATLFLSVLAAYLSTFHWHGGDDLPSILLPFAVLRHRTLALDPYIDDWLMGENRFYLVASGTRYLAVYPPATGLLALPAYVIPWLAGTTITVTLLKDLSKISASLITAFSVVFFWRSIASRCSREWTLCLCLLYGLGSWAFSVSSQALWQHGPCQLAVTLGLWGLSRTGRIWDAVAGFGFAAAAAARPDNVFFGVALVLYFLFYRPRRLLGFLGGAAPPVVLTVAYWLHYMGRLRPPELGVQAGMLGTFQLRACWALLASPTRGLFLFFPAAVFGVWAAWRRRAEREGLFLLSACVAQGILFSCYWGWVGGNTFGSRYFAVAALVLAWLCAGVETEIRRSPLLIWTWSLCVGYSILVHAVGAYCPWPGPPGIAEQKLSVWTWSLHPLACLVTTDRATGISSVAGRLGFLAVGLMAAGFLSRRIWDELRPGRGPA